MAVSPYAMKLDVISMVRIASLAERINLFDALRSLCMGARLLGLGDRQPVR
jgi:hypothetical protein